MSVLKKRLVQNGAANLFNQLVTVIVQFAAVSVFLRFWTKEDYGRWILISAIPSYLGLAEAGFSTISANEISMAVSRGDLERAKRSLHTAWVFLLAMSVMVMAGVALGLAFLPWPAWFSLRPGVVGQIGWAIALLAVYSVIGLWLTIFAGVYRGSYKNARYGFAISLSRLLELACIVGSVAASHSIVVVAGAMLAARILTLLGLRFDSGWTVPALRLGFAHFAWSELKATWRPSVLFMVFPLGNALYFQGLTLMVGAELGAVAVVVFNTTRALTRAIVQFVTMIKASLWPEFSYLFGKGDLAKARRLNGVAFEVTWILSLVMAAGIFFAAPWTMRIWTHRVVGVSEPLLVLLLVSAVLNSLWFVTSGLIMGVNRHEGLAVCYLGATGGALLAGAFLVRRYGLAGAGWAMVGCEILLLPCAIRSACRVAGQTVTSLVRESIRLKLVRELLAEHLGKRSGRRKLSPG
jgi:O-antigen/teichoic acid export membrane protein